MSDSTSVRLTGCCFRSCVVANLRAIILFMTALFSSTIESSRLTFIYKVIGGQTDRLIGDVMDTFIGEGRGHLRGKVRITH